MPRSASPSSLTMVCAIGTMTRSGIMIGTGNGRTCMSELAWAAALGGGAMHRRSSSANVEYLGGMEFVAGGSTCSGGSTYAGGASPE
jgi:hypothetical protein